MKKKIHLTKRTICISLTKKFRLIISAILIVKLTLECTKLEMLVKIHKTS